MKKYVLMLAAAALLMSSCLKKDSSGSSLPPTGFFLIQASPDAPAADIYANATIVLQNVSFGTDSGYLFGMPGAYKISMTQTASATTLGSQSFTFVSNTYQSIFAIDSVSKLKFVQVSDVFTNNLSTDSVKVRYLDFSPDAPFHIAKFADATDSITYTGRIFNDQEGTPSLANFITIKAGTYDVSLSQPGSGTPFKTFSKVLLSGGKAYTFYLKGFYTGIGAEALGLGTVVHF